MLSVGNDRGFGFEFDFIVVLAAWLWLWLWLWLQASDVYSEDIASNAVDRKATEIMVLSTKLK